MAEVRTVIVGVGNRARKYLRHLVSHSVSARVVALIDTDWLFHLLSCTSMEDIPEMHARGSLSKYRPSSAPEGYSDRCISCPMESGCRYSAVDLYLRRGEWTDICLSAYHAGVDFTVLDDFFSSVQEGQPMSCTLSESLPATIAYIRISRCCNNTAVNIKI